MCSIPILKVTDSDIRRVRQFLIDCAQDAYVLERTKENVVGPAPKFDRERFWYVMLGCLLTTRQRSTAGSAVDDFLSQKNFPLTLACCGKNVEEVVERSLTNFGGIRMAPTIAQRASSNHAWLQKDGWPRVERWFNKLAEQRGRSPQTGDAKLEREAARFADVRLEGFGPKQSRNLWQWLGLTRYETPLDSRVCDWINQNLSARVDTDNLSDSCYYETVMDYDIAVCSHASVLPCLWDAAAFDNSDSRSGCCNE
jgi:hypothetical protein